MNEEEKIFMEFLDLQKRMQTLRDKYVDINKKPFVDEKQIPSEMSSLKNKMIVCYICQKEEDRINISTIHLGSPSLMLLIRLISFLGEQQKEFIKTVSKSTEDIL